MSKKILIFTILLSFIISLGLLTTSVYAYKLQVEYPTIPVNPDIIISEDSDFIDLIRYFYVFGLGLIGVVAVGVLIYGGIMYMLAGTVTSTEDARKYIWGAVAGLVLAFGSYIILYTINPDLVNFQLDVKPAPSEFPTRPLCQGDTGACYASCLSGWTEAGTDSCESGLKCCIYSSGSSF